MHEWDTFAVVVGGSAGALVGLLFVAISIHAGRIAESADLRGRAAQTLVIFAALLLVGLLRSIPVQPEWVLGIELVILAVFVAFALIALDHLAQQSDSPRPVARTLQAINPSTLTAGGVAVRRGADVVRCLVGGLRTGARRLRGDDRRTGERLVAVDQAQRLTSSPLKPAASDCAVSHATPPVAA